VISPSWSRGRSCPADDLSRRRSPTIHSTAERTATPLRGTFTILGDSVSISQTAETFVRDADRSRSGMVLGGTCEASVSVRLIRR